FLRIMNLSQNILTTDEQCSIRCVPPDRNIGRNWIFSEQQKSLLRKYYDANKLLVDCLINSGCNVSPAVRQEIEETLLFPIAHLQKTDDKCDRPL
ncbi:NACHT C-terminal helical domain 2-containing protein, partial [Microcoleus sp. AT3-D2]|uniref:NACHT C-terminal helical domain 2-containing protein n=1 Tax=Microcoleus sp. AT3-D2 TaxID=2818612 RepID=UPI002FD7253D